MSTAHREGLATAAGRLPPQDSALLEKLYASVSSALGGGKPTSDRHVIETLGVTRDGSSGTRFTAFDPDTGYYVTLTKYVGIDAPVLMAGRILVLENKQGNAASGYHAGSVRVYA